ncbi:MAG: type II CAAX endopeptidase family protein [Methanobacterium sp.]|jgi:hypothetical protein|nr:type II CAAX endopeptidase family protein [Methanobacterium sp.]
MSEITFLDNAKTGKNNWWRYILTIALSMGISFIATLVLFIVFIILYVTLLPAGASVNFLSSVSDIVNNPFVLIMITGVLYLISTFIFYVCVRFLHKKKFLSIINAVPSFRWKMLLKGIGLWFLILFLFSLPELIFSPSSYQFTFNPQNFGLLLVLCLLVFPIQASLEELVFRGYLMQGFSLLTKKPWIPLLLTSIIFSIMHYWNGTGDVGIAIMISTFIIGFMLGIIALGENGIETAMGIHIGNNLYVALIFNSTDSGLPNVPSLVTSQPTDPFAGIPFMIIMALLTITILFWNRKDDLIRIFR